MKAPVLATLLVTFALAASTTRGLPDDGAPPVRPAKPDEAAAARPAGIAWFGTWDVGSAEAKRTGRPILLVAAAPQCHGAPGVW